jgi:hypothetical protein
VASFAAEVGEACMGCCLDLGVVGLFVSMGGCSGSVGRWRDMNEGKRYWGKVNRIPRVKGSSDSCDGECRLCGVVVTGRGWSADDCADQGLADKCLI